jgi:transaldolase
MSKNPLSQLTEYGQSFWFDNIHRAMLNGELDAMIAEDDLRGITSNPTIFEKAINGSSEYDNSLAKLLQNNPNGSARDYFFSLAMEDIQAAADKLLPVYEKTNGVDGYVSLEVSPDLAYDTRKSISEAMDLFARLGRPNIMIKIPSTREGVAAVEHLIGEGVNVNATLLFSVERYMEIAQAFIRGLQKRHARGHRIDNIASVASFFVSRVDSSVDKALQALVDEGKAENPEAVKALLGKYAIANAKRSYTEYKKMFNSPGFQTLKNEGAQPQRLLWASTGVKNPDYRDVMYIEELIGPHTVNTIPPATYKAFKEHGNLARTLEENPDEAETVHQQVAALGVDLHAIMDKLESDGVQSFADSFTTLLEAIDNKADQLRQQSSSSAA